ncbi:MAG: hypothetical protein IKN26_04340, partial [Eubacterium sp.]|nr:hypothetical protein [Eubacterium sp.]
MSLVFNHSALTSGWKRYYIMHKNRRVASIREDGTCTVYYKSFLPFNLWIEEGRDMNTRLNNLNNFYYWCASRVLTLDRKYAKEILNAIGAKQATTDRDRALIAISYRALSLTDVYWIAVPNEKKTFEEISLYSHSLSNSFADVSLCGKQITAQNEELLSNNSSDLSSWSATATAASYPLPIMTSMLAESKLIIEYSCRSGLIVTSGMLMLFSNEA